MNQTTEMSSPDEMSHPDAGLFGRPLFEDPSARALSRVGVVDVGSNSVRLVVFDGAARSPAYFFNEKVMAGLGQGLAQHGLGFMYMQGECVAQDAHKALEWFEKAAEQGLQGAMTTIGMMYREGNGVERDEEQAKEWFRKAGFDDF